MTILQFIIIALISYLVFSMLFRNSYDSLIIKVVIGLSYVSTAFIFACLSFRLAKWYSNNQSFTVLLFFVVTLSIAFRIAAIFPFYESLLTEIPQIRTLESPMPDYNPNVLLNNIYGISSAVSSLLLWISTSILLRHYYDKLGKQRYYLLMAVIVASAIYSMSDFVLTPAPESYFGDVWYWVFTAFQGLLLGVATGTPFWSISNALKKSKNASVSNSLLICGFAFCMFITSGSAIIDHAPYPPFGLVAIVCMQLSAYMLFVGLYSSAISVSEDTNLRINLRKNLLEQTKFLDSIGSAEMEQELMKRVINISLKESDKIQDNMGIEPSVNEEEMKQYLKEILQEIKNKKSKIR
ncbi:MAG: hypothetical protein H0U27_08400 [Nitrosopumilus sp.]|nr:hypothetical protein [Nitrosopumilus sp.]